MNRGSFRFWLVRLPMSFLLIGAFLAWEIYKSVAGTAPRLPPWKLSIYCLAIAMCAALFVVGMRERHRRE